MQFSDIVGHESIKQKLVQEVKAGRVSHAQLFLGNEGSGNLALVWAFIQYLFCDQQTDDSCGTCTSCKQISKLEHPDLHVAFPTAQALSKTTDPLVADWRKAIIENPYLTLNDWIHLSDDKGRKPTISVHEAKNMVQKLTLKSFGDKYKVMLIWMAEWMGTETANKLLKIIEEPPANTLFFLVANSQDMILPTILSRTQMNHVPALKSKEIQSFLVEKYQLDQDKAATVALMSDGNMNKAISLSQHHDDEDHFLESFVEWMRMCYKKNVVGMINWSMKMAAESRTFQKSFLEYTLYMMRSSIHMNYATELAENTPDKEADFLKNFAQFINGKNILEFHQLFSESHYQIDRNANAKILFTDTSFQIMKLLHQGKS